MADRDPRVARLASAYRATFSSPEGARVLRDLMRFCGCGSTSYVPGEPQAVLFNEGKRRVALRIASMMRLAPGVLPTLALEDDHAA